MLLKVPPVAFTPVDDAPAAVDPKPWLPGRFCWLSPLADCVYMDGLDEAFTLITKGQEL